MTLPSPKKYSRRYKRWQQEVQLMSPFVMFCGIIAAIYFIYRLTLIITPLVTFEQSVIPDSNRDIVCSEEEGSNLNQSAPLLSASYQQRIQKQAPLSNNLVANADLSKLNPISQEPTGYYHSADLVGSKYTVLQDQESPRYLHVSTTKATPTTGIPAAWQLTPVSIESEKTYAYSFFYRSNVPVNVSIETTVNGKPAYKEVMTLDASSSWQQFTAHFVNDKQATNFRMDINGTAQGYVDTRGFDIHGISDAALPSGMVTVAFDDGWQSVNDKAVSLFKKYGIRTTQYIISDVANHNVTNYMNYDEIVKLKKAGHEIGSHSSTHCNQTLLNTNDLTNDASKSKQMLEQKGLGPIKTFAYPLGQYNEKTQEVYEKSYPFVRSSDFGFNDRYFDETNIHSIGIVSTTSDAQFKAWLDYAKSQKAWVVFVYHKVDSNGQYNTTSTQLDHQLKIIKDSGLEVKPLSEAASTIRK